MRTIRRVTITLTLLSAVAALSVIPSLANASQQLGAAGGAGISNSVSSGTVARPAAGAVQTNSHWSGYVTTAGSDTSVQASWVEPKVDCSRGGDVVFWVGLGGYGANEPLTQDGTYVQCENSRAYYSAWWETWPCNSIQQFNVSVSPGDHITATVALTGNNRYQLTVSDTTQGWTENPTKTGCNGGSTASAEVITETPSYGSTFAALPDFGTVNYTAASVNNSSLSSSNPFPIVMARGSDTMDSTSAISGGTAFSNTWLANS